MLVLKCPDCSYGTLQAGNDPKGIELKELQGIHNKTFLHNAEIQQATVEDMIKYKKEPRK